MPLSRELTWTDAEILARCEDMKSDQDAADLLQIPLLQLRFVLWDGRNNYPYRTFEIRKRSGGVRQIAAPHRSLRILQRKFLRVLNLLAVYRRSAHGFVPSRSIVTNALPHAGKRLVVNVDLADFFPSIHFGRVRGVLEAKPFNFGRPAATVFAQLCTRDGLLPQGAPTSPLLSNLICFRLDSELARLAKKENWYYTRYADDLTFSSWSRSVPSSIGRRMGGSEFDPGDELLAIIASNGFELNTEKTRVDEAGVRQTVTGLVVNEFPNVPRSFIRNTRAMLHDAAKNGVEAAERRLRSEYYARTREPGLRSPDFLRVVRGRLDFVKMVKGDQDPVYLNLVHQARAVSPDIIPEPVVAPYVVPDRLAKIAGWVHWSRSMPGLSSN